MNKTLKKVTKSVSIIILSLLLFENSYYVALALTDYFDPDTPGFDICEELRNLINPYDPAYKVGNMEGIVDTTAITGDTDDNTVCEDCINGGKIWRKIENQCYNGFPQCWAVGPPASNCTSDVSDCPSPPPVTLSGGFSSDIFQEWFIDACVMDGYLTEVAHIDQIHDFEVEGSVFEGGGLFGIGATKEMNLGKLFEEAFMEVTRAKDETGAKNKELTEASMKDFLLAVKDSNEQFMTDLMQAVMQQENEGALEELKSYELAKIEKAREDVNKLTYEVYRELKEEPLVYNIGLTADIVRSLGLKVREEKSDICPFGVLVGNQCVVIKKEGRVIQNVDDFVYEEAIQKARDFTMCFFAPERHFPIGEDYYFAASSTERNKILKNNKFRDGTEPDFTAIDEAMGVASGGMPYCGKEKIAETINTLPPIVEADYPGLPDNYYGNFNVCQASREQGSRDLKLIKDCREEIRNGLDSTCNTENICEMARQEADITFEYERTDADGNPLLPGKGRPDLFEPTINPDTGASQDFDDYKKLLCPSDQIKEDMKRDYLFELARKYKFLYQAPPEHWYYSDNKICPLILANLGYDIDGVIEDELGNPLLNSTRRAYKYYQKATWEPSLLLAVAYRPDPSSNDYNLQSSGLFKNTGFGIQSQLQNLIGKIISDYETLRLAEYNTGEGLRAEKYLVGFPDPEDGKYHFIDTENIISPALFLKEKVAAATQAQFDLAQKAWKDSPDQGGSGELTCPYPYNGELEGGFAAAIEAQMNENIPWWMKWLTGPVVKLVAQFVSDTLTTLIPEITPDMSVEQAHAILKEKTTELISTGLATYLKANGINLHVHIPLVIDLDVTQMIADWAADMVVGLVDDFLAEILPGIFGDNQDTIVFESMCKEGELEHGWYLVSVPVANGDPPKYECRWPQFNDITCSNFGYIVTSPVYSQDGGAGNQGLPNELPAPWEDFNDYMKIPDSYKGWFEGEIQVGEDAGGTPITITGHQAGLRKAPPAFESPEYASLYSDLADSYPDIYGKAYDKGAIFPTPSEDYYTNKWYKGVTQLYEKPMSEILRTWFQFEEEGEPYPEGAVYNSGGLNLNALAQFLANLNLADLSSLLSGLNLSDLAALFNGLNLNDLANLNLADLSTLLSGLNLNDLTQFLNGFDPDIFSNLLGGLDPNDLGSLLGSLNPAAFNNLLQNVDPNLLSGLGIDPNNLNLNNLGQLFGDLSSGDFGSLLSNLGPSDFSSFVDNAFSPDALSGLLNDFNPANLGSILGDLSSNIFSGLFGG